MPEENARVPVTRKYTAILGARGSWRLDIIVTLGIVHLVAGARLLIDYWISGVIPYALLFPAVAGAVMLASPRAGLMTLVHGLLLTWYFIVPVQNSFLFANFADAVGLVLVVIALLILLWSVSAYQRADDLRKRSDAERIGLLELALKELDHRTKNNFLLAASLLHLQARRHDSKDVRHELQTAASRLLALESAHSNLAVLGDDIEVVSLRGYLQHMVEMLRQGACPRGVTIDSDVADVTISRRAAINLGLICNELITNALKHAFPQGEGHIHLAARVDGAEFRLVITDDGVGIVEQKALKDSLGTEIVHLLLTEIGGTMKSSSKKGSSFQLIVPFRSLLQGQP